MSTEVGTAIMSDEIADILREEYNTLIYLKYSNADAEQMLEEYFYDTYDFTDTHEDVFWFALAYYEWNRGRLSEKVKNKALECLHSGRNQQYWYDEYYESRSLIESFSGFLSRCPENREQREKQFAALLKGRKKQYQKRLEVLEKFEHMLLSPMPPEKKPWRPFMRRCPYKTGDLLAYRIMSYSGETIYPECMGKYALLRVVKVEKEPISRIVPDEIYTENMYVGLYGWLGDSIPDPSIVNELEYIGYTNNPKPDLLYLDKPFFESEAYLEAGLEDEGAVKKVVEAATRVRTDTCVSFFWENNGFDHPDITVLDCDKSFEESTPEFFDTSILNVSLVSYYAFDAMLIARLHEYLK